MSCLHKKYLINLAKLYFDHLKIKILDLSIKTSKNGQFCPIVYEVGLILVPLISIHSILVI